jgi:hypothetical protein
MYETFFDSQLVMGNIYGKELIPVQGQKCPIQVEVKDSELNLEVRNFPGLRITNSEFLFDQLYIDIVKAGPGMYEMDFYIMFFTQVDDQGNHAVNVKRRTRYRI